MLTRPSAAGKRTGGNASGMVVARLAGDLARHQPARRLEVEHEHLGLEQARLHPTPDAGAGALEQRDHDAEGQQIAGREVGDRDADAHRPLPGQTGDRHQPAHALRDLIDAGAGAVRPVLAEAADAAVDDALG